MKPSKTALIETMRMAIGSQFEVETVTRTIARNLPLLRGLYRENQAQFSSDDLAFLQQTRAILTALDDYTELAEQWRELTDADASQLVDGLLDLKQQIGDLACAAEFDVLIQRIADRSGLIATEQAIAERCAALQGEVPGCPRCEQQMVMRQSSFGPFWGCPRFPKCWGKRSLDAAG